MVVLVVNVPNGRQPVYYCSNTPYVRHLTESRPAEPHEVLELISDYLHNLGIGEDESINDARSLFYSELTGVVGEVLIYADQADDRNVNPWLEQWRSEFGYAAAELRELSAQDIAIDEDIDNELKELAVSLDEVASLRLTLGCGPNLQRLTEQAKTRLVAIKQEKIDSIELDDDSLTLVRNTIITTDRKLQDLVSRAHSLVESGKIQELQAEASELGHDLLRLAQYNIDGLGDNIREELKTIGRSLHLTETMRLYMDGGKSTQAIVNKISESSDHLDQVIKQSL